MILDPAMPDAKSGFNRVLDDLARRQLHLDFEFGTAAEKYEPVRSIGAGAFGIVCEAEETSSDGGFTKVNDEQCSQMATLLSITVFIIYP